MILPSPAVFQAQSDFAPGVHYVVRHGMEPAITLTENDRVIDLNHFELHGARNGQQERYSGVGLLLDHCRNLTLRNGNIQGYKINVLLRDCNNVRLEGMRADFSHSLPIQTAVGQPINQFLNLRNVDDWTTYGAGFWLHNCVDCHLVRCTAHHAMNGAILVASNNCTVFNCDLSYNSAWGLGLWGSSGNRLIWNHIDFCNRPWSGGWGGDAADLVVVSGSNKNVVVGNSLTHGGDGFFLADRVQGGWSDTDKKFHYQDNCNDNLVWDNDGSWASANAFEATFSHGNSFGRNLADNSDYGFWLGYSSDSLLIHNQIDRNDHDGVAIEHGQSNRIVDNTFDSDGEAAIHLWSTPGDKDRDKPSTDNTVTHNLVANCGAELDLKGSTKTENNDNGAKADVQEADEPAEVTAALKLKPKKWKSYRESGGPTGQAWIQTGNYAPVPFINYGAAYVNSTTYKLWFAKVPDHVDAPSWLTVTRGSNPHYMTATAKLQESETGSDKSAVISFDLTPTPASGPVVAPVTDSDLGVIAATQTATPRKQMLLRFRTGGWDCKWFAWKNLKYDDRNAWLYLFSSAPLSRQTLPNLNADYSYKSPDPGVVPTDHFALLATRRFEFTAGIYRFSTVSDDGIRLFVDGREVISRWNHHGAMSDAVDVALTRGTHDLRVEYFQEDGGAQLKVDWTRIKRLSS